MEVSRRVALPSDTEFARTVHHRAYRDVVERQFGAWDNTLQDTFFAGDWAHGGFDILLCDGGTCGYVCVEEHAEHVLVREIVVAPEFQGRGIGTTVLRQVMERARALGVPVVLGALHLNRAADLYRRLGFRENGRSATHTGFEWRPEADPATTPTS
jgi:ribosomal protein S18 acetylase RimI-like enzyme